MVGEMALLECSWLWSQRVLAESALIARYQKRALLVPTFKLVQRLLEERNRSVCVIVSPFISRGFLGMTVMSRVVFISSIGSSNYAERKILSNTHMQPGSFVLRIRKPW